jgi:hypothetical protein
VSSHASRFAAHLAALNCGALAVVAAMAFRPAVAAWITFGVAAATVIAALAAFAVPAQGAAARTWEVLLVLVGAWAILCTRVFGSPHVLKWLCFSCGVAIWALGALGLITHEVLVEGRLRRSLSEPRHRTNNDDAFSRRSGEREAMR